MKEGPDIASVAALIGDPARANMLSALMAGMALTAGELAAEAGVAAPTASGHLKHLVAAGLLLVEVQGRHRYYRIAGPDVAEAIETLGVLAARTGRLRARPGPKDEAMRQARRCYDHLAGALGVAMFDAFVAQGLIAQGSDGLVPTQAGRARFAAEGIDLAALGSRHRPICRACLDWSERRPHLAGALGSALMTTILARGWAKADPGNRAIRFSATGRAAFAAFLRPAPKHKAALSG